MVVERNEQERVISFLSINKNQLMVFRIGISLVYSQVDLVTILIKEVGLVTILIKKVGLVTINETFYLIKKMVFRK